MRYKTTLKKGMYEFTHTFSTLQQAETYVKTFLNSVGKEKFLWFNKIE